MENANIENKTDILTLNLSDVDFFGLTGKIKMSLSPSAKLKTSPLSNVSLVEGRIIDNPDMLINGIKIKGKDSEDFSLSIYNIKNGMAYGFCTFENILSMGGVANFLTEEPLSNEGLLSRINKEKVSLDLKDIQLFEKYRKDFEEGKIENKDEKSLVDTAINTFVGEGGEGNLNLFFSDYIDKYKRILSSSLFFYIALNDLDYRKIISLKDCGKKIYRYRKRNGSLVFKLLRKLEQEKLEKIYQDLQAYKESRYVFEEEFYQNNIYQDGLEMLVNPDKFFEHFQYID